MIAQDIERKKRRHFGIPKGTNPGHTQVPPGYAHVPVGINSGHTHVPVGTNPGCGKPLGGEFVL